MSRGGFVFVVVALLIGATIPALLTTTQTKGYPASPHYGNAYIGEFWLEEMNITLDTANSSGYDVAKMVKGHVKAQNDWIVYDPDNSIVANYSIQIGDKHPKFNLTLWLEVHEVKSNLSTCVGTAVYSIECKENQSCSLAGNINISLNNINFPGGNSTLVCYLGATIYSQIKVGLNPVKNITYQVEDRSIVAIEENKNTNTDFSWYVNQADEYLPSLWKYIPGLQYGPPKAQEVWGVEQTVAFFIDENYGENANEDQGANGAIERKTWTFAYLLIKSDWVNLLMGHSPVEIALSQQLNPFMKWNASIEERDSGEVVGPAEINFDIDWGLLPAHVFVIWKANGPRVNGGAVWSCRYDRKDNREIRNRILGDDSITVRIPGYVREDNQSSYDVPPFDVIVWANLHFRVFYSYELHLDFVNESNDGGGDNNNTTTNTYYPTWADAVAYRVIAATPIEVTSLSEGSVTTEKMNIGDFVRDSSNDIYIYIYGGDTGDYRVEIDG